MADYIDREILMKFLIRRDHCDKEHANEHFINGIETVMEYAENLPAADVEPVKRWIPCSDKLPEKDGQYLVAHAPTGWMGVRNFSLEKSFDEVSENFYRVRIHKHNVWWYMDDELYARVSTVITHWMPLPEPPEMDGGGEDA